MTYGQIVGLVFIIFVLLVALILIKHFAIILERLSFEIMMDRKKKREITEEQKPTPYKGNKKDMNGAIEVQNRIGFQ